MQAARIFNMHLSIVSWIVLMITSIYMGAADINDKVDGVKRELRDDTMNASLFRNGANSSAFDDYSDHLILLMLFVILVVPVTFFLHKRRVGR